MVKVECEYCKKDIYKKRAFEIREGIVELDSDGAGFWNGSGTPDKIKGDGLFCSLKCMEKWLHEQ